MVFSSVLEPVKCNLEIQLHILLKITYVCILSLIQKGKNTRVILMQIYPEEWIKLCTVFKWSILHRYMSLDHWTGPEKAWNGVMDPYQFIRLLAQI